MQEKRVWNRLRDEELIEILKSMEASKLHPVKAQKIYEKIKLNAAIRKTNTLTPVFSLGGSNSILLTLYFSFLIIASSGEHKAGNLH